MILLRYLKSATYVKNAAANRERAKFLQMVEIFRKYGERYDVDWLLMAAQDIRNRGSINRYAATSAQSA